MDISDIAKELGKRGGEKTKERLKKDPDYYKKIGKRGGEAGKGSKKHKANQSPSQ